MFARDVGGAVVEVTRRQKDKLLDQEIASALTEPKTKTKTKTKTKAFNRSARRALATAILENVPLNAAARAAIDTARETADANEHKRALRTLKAGLPATLWISYDPKSARGHAQTIKPVWNDPQGDDSGLWRQIALEEIVSLLVEAL
jgi:hypothetical protein